MLVDLFIKRMPKVIKELIAREAFENRRSINQEAIALLEEALVGRVGESGMRRRGTEALLKDYAAGAGAGGDPAGGHLETSGIAPN